MLEKESSHLPFVSVIVPMFNEEKYIEDCLKSLFDQDYPEASYEVIVVNGNSTDTSPQIVKKMSSIFSNIMLLDNPERIIPKSLNIGIRAAKGEIIVRMDAHAIPPSNYISTCVKHLLDKEVSNVGGIMIPEGNGYWMESIALGTSSVFGIGNSKHRYSLKEGYDEAGWLGSFWKTSLLEVGLYNETMKLNEDDDLNYRLIKNGKKVFRTPEIKIKYIPRDSLKKLWRQYFNYGLWKVPVIKRYGTITAFRHFIPSVFIITIIIFTLQCILGKSYCFLLIAVILIYLMSSIIIAAIISNKKGFKYLPALPLVFATLHFSYGLGFILGTPRFFSKE